MTLVGLFSDKGSPGVTTLALSLAAGWPRPVAVVECDPAGGDLALRLTDPSGRPAMRLDPGLLSLAAAARRDTAPHLIEHTQPIPGLPSPGPMVAVGVSSPEQGAGIAGLWPQITSALTAASVDVLADLGRAHPGNPALPVAAAADVLIGVARGDAEGSLRIRDRLVLLLPALAARPGRQVAVVLVGEDRRAAPATASMRTVLDAAGLADVAVGFLALDSGAVDGLHQGRGHRVGRSLLVRSARGLVDLMAHPTVASSFPPQRGEPRKRRPILVRAR